MADIRTTTTNYVHPHDPNLLNIHKAMKFNNSGEPVVRTHVDGITLEGDVIVDAVKIWDGTHYVVLEQPNNDGEAGSWSLSTENYNMVFNGSTWDRMRGNTTTGLLVNLTNSNINVTGTVTISTGQVVVSNFTSTVNVSSLPAVSGTVTVSNFTSTVNINSLPAVTVSNFTSTVHVDNFPTSITVTNFTSTVHVDNFPTTSTVYQGTTPWAITGTVNIGTMPEVEIKNDTGNPVPISATTAANSALNPIYIAGNVSTIGGSAQGKLWFFQIAQGLIPGHIPLFKAGYNPSVANNSEESIWAHSNLYPWDSWGAGGTLSCVSTSASDTGTMTITGLRSSDWTEVTETVTLTGLTPVVTTTSFIRINLLHYNGVNGAANVGEIDVSRNGTVVGDIHPGNGIAQMAQYTVPAGYTAYLLTGNANLGKGNDGTGRFKYRPYGSSFQTAMMFLLYQSTFNYEFAAPLPLPEKTDLDVTLTASVSGTAVTCAYSMILIANTIP